MSAACRPLRVAYLGPAPNAIGGVPAMAGETLHGLADSGVELEIFLDATRSVALDELAARRDVRVHALSTGWAYDRWYSSTKTTALATGTAARVRVGARLAQRLAERHAVRPFDVVYRLSQIELLALRPLRDVLPPIVLHPEVHAQGELRHHWRERDLALRAGSPARFALMHSYLAYRSRVQRRDLRDVTRVIAPSERFAELLAADCGLRRDRIDVIPNPIDLDRFTPAATSPEPAPVRLLFVARMAVRKGVEQIVELSRRIGDLAGQVRIDCVGGSSLFSDYTPLMADLNPAVARYLGHVPATEMPTLLRASHGCLQPSWYEPFALTVGEALASGLPVVVSDEVGAGERADPRLCRRHAAGDIDGLEREVRRLVADLRNGWDPASRDVARAHAEEHFSRERFAMSLVGVLERAAAQMDSRSSHFPQRSPV